MERLDLYYKAFDAFKSIISEDAETTRFRKFSSASVGKKFENMTVVFNKVEIETDWIEKMEFGLNYVEKAIKEDRQFIKNEGEVLPIEKIRRTSVAGIQDLAKHSNYITHDSDLQSDASVIPDKMLMIQRESDYAVYENRVVYALLVYLRDFIAVRLQKIKELTNRFDVSMFSNKTIEFGDRKVEYSFTLNEIRNNDPVMMEKNSAKDEIDRLDRCMSLVMAFLKTPLMNEVSKSELVTRPITKTNVLKMNTNFRESLSLFDYIADYQGDGYKITKIEKSFAPFSNDIVNNYADLIAFGSFITYMHANSLEGELKENLKRAREEDKLKDQEKILAKLRAFEKKGKLDQKTIEEYFGLFVDGYKILEKRCDDFDIEIKELNEQHIKELDAQKIKFDNELLETRESYEKEIEEQKQKYESIIKEKDEEHSNRIEDLIDQHRQDIQAMSNQHSNEMQKLIDAYEEKLTIFENEKNTAVKERDEAVSHEDELQSRITAYKLHFNEGLKSEDFTGKEAFDELEKLKEAFDKFFKESWKKAKENIRKSSIKIEKKPNKKNKSDVKVEVVLVDEKGDKE